MDHLDEDGPTMARPDEPVVNICRHECTGTTAQGHDPLVSLLLRRAGFITEDYFHQRYRRLPYDLSDGVAERMATNAARMLRACHYQVRIDADLDLDAPPGDWTPCPVHPDLPRPKTT
ncbi:hypothetical protein DN069_07585 [Streptacidiphilus pinicola]|uniref:Uncharacterized protein n=1 Tax=Streptacidiphilus pinicola TaxID=2219663 RepID=A0A2X0KGJ7_9ACTN|nr:hypothetical protein [Streptacidiphilus pinicola]RAG86209.1 hypothetical protein DN069_07585 [Streptacidiphilus pinicola]